MKRSVFALVLALFTALCLVACGGQNAQPQPIETTAPTETTAPPALSPAELFAQARDAIDNAQELELAVTLSEKRTVGGDTYSEAITQTISLEGAGTDALSASLSETITAGEYVYNSKEYYAHGTVYLMFDNAPFSAQLTQEEYLSRLVPAVLIDASLYGEITLQPGVNGDVLVFSQPTAGESWAVPENAELLSAQGNASLDANGNLVKTSYTASYQYGSTQYDISVSVQVTVATGLNLTNTLPASQAEYISVACIDAPYLLRRATSDMHQADNLTGRIIDTLITYAGGAISSQQMNIDLYGTGPDAMSNYTADVTLQGAAGILDEVSLTENIQNGILEYTEDDGDPITQELSESELSWTRDTYLSILLDSIWTPDSITGAELTDLGSVYLLELTGNDALGEKYAANGSNTFWMDEDFLDNLASDYDTSKLEAYLSIDKYTQLPVAFGYSFEGVHTIEGAPYTLSDQWDQTMFLSSNTAYTAITEEPLPDVEPKEKATPLFYHVTGENGQEMWLMGTIHVGDNRTGYLPQEVYDALDHADALAVEFDTDAFTEALENDDDLVSQVRDAYFYPDGSMTKDHLDEETYELGVKLLKATGNYYMNMEYMKPYFWGQSIENFFLQQGYGLVSEKGVDNRLLDRAREKGIEILDIESGVFQVQMMGNYSGELQELLLQDALGSDSAEYCASVDGLYEKWCQGNEEVMRDELSTQVDTSELTEEELAEYQEQKPLIDEYNKAMSYDRNQDMLQAAIDYLESGETIFYAVGLAHLLDDTNGLVDTLRAAGYTVELVVFSK